MGSGGHLTPHHTLSQNKKQILLLLKALDLLKEISELSLIHKGSKVAIQNFLIQKRNVNKELQELSKRPVKNQTKILYSSRLKSGFKGQIATKTKSMAVLKMHTSSCIS